MTLSPSFRSLSIGLIIITTLLASQSAGASVRPNRALRFDGVSGSVDIVAPAGVPLAARFTFEAWIRPAAFAGTQGVFGTLRGEGTGQAGVGLVIDAGGRLGLMWTTAGGASDALWCSSPLVAGAWAHVAATRDATTLRLFVDGVQVASRPFAGVVVPMDSALAVGGIRGVADGHYSGEIDEVRIWAESRSAEDLRRDQHLRLLGRERGLVGYFPFDEGAGSTSVDAVTRIPLAQLTGGIEWVPSTVAIGAGAGAHLTVKSPGRQYFNGTDLLIDFLRTSRGNDIAVTSLLDGALPLPEGLRRVVQRSWLLGSWLGGDGYYYATLTFHLGRGAFGAADVATPSNLRLYAQRVSGDTSWRELGAALRIDTDAGTVTFGPLETGSNGFDGERLRLLIGTSGDSPLPVPGDLRLLEPLTAPSVCFGYGATLAVEALGRNLVYRWYHDGVLIEDVAGPQIPIQSTMAEDSGWYAVVITDQDGAVLRSDSAFLDVTVPPDVYSDPTDVRVLEGRRFEFIAYVRGTDLSFQWQHNGVDIPGATNMWLDFGPVDTTMSGVYRLQVWNACGRDSSVAARLTVEKRPPVLGVVDDAGTSHIVVAPNPASERLVVTVPFAGRAVSCALVDGGGRRTVLVPTRGHASDRIELDLSGVPAGSYLLELRGVDGVALATRVVVR